MRRDQPLRVRQIQVNQERQLPLRSEEHTSELQSQSNLVCRLLLEKKKNKTYNKLFTKILAKYNSITTYLNHLLAPSTTLISRHTLHQHAAASCILLYMSSSLNMIS